MTNALYSHDICYNTFNYFNDIIFVNILNVWFGSRYLVLKGNSNVIHECKNCNKCKTKKFKYIVIYIYAVYIYVYEFKICIYHKDTFQIIIQYLFSIKVIEF